MISIRKGGFANSSWHDSVASRNTAFEQGASLMSFFRRMLQGSGKGNRNDHRTTGRGRQRSLRVEPLEERSLLSVSTGIGPCLDMLDSGSGSALIASSAYSNSDSESLSVVSVTPSRNSQTAQPTADVSIVFSQAIDPASVTAQTLIVRNVATGQAHLARDH